MNTDLKGAYAFPPSRNQAQLWLQEQTQQLGSSYHITSNHLLRGPVRPNALEAALHTLIARHESLRTVFRVLDGELCQVVLPRFDVRVERSPDLTGLNRIAERRFDLEHGPLIRAVLVRQANDEHVFGLVLHHLVADGWSVDLLLRELTAVYEAVVSEREIDLPSISLQYADLTLWEQESLTAEFAAKEIDFWRQELAGSAPALELPLDRPRSAVRHHAAASHEFTVPTVVAHSLEELAGRCGATLNMLMMAAFQVLLARYSGQERFAVGTVSAGRPSSEFEPVVGFFATLLPMPADLRGKPAFVDVVARVRKHILDALAHQRLPFDQLVSELKPQRVEGASPIFQVTFQLLHDNGPGSWEAAGVTFEPIASNTKHAASELSLAAVRGVDLRCAFHWSTALFDETTVRRMADNFLTLLESITHTPDDVVWHLPFIAREERGLLERWSGRSLEQGNTGAN